MVKSKYVLEPDSKTASLDHIVIILPSLKYLPASLTYPSCPFTLVQGGKHAENLTENILIPLQDGSYLELLAFIPPPPQTAPKTHDDTDDDGNAKANLPPPPDPRECHWWGKKPEYSIADWCLAGEPPACFVIAKKEWHPDPKPAVRERIRKFCENEEEGGQDEVDEDGNEDDDDKDKTDNENGGRNRSKGKGKADDEDEDDIGVNDENKNHVDDSDDSTKLYDSDAYDYDPHGDRDSYDSDDYWDYYDNVYTDREYSAGLVKAANEKNAPDTVIYAPGKYGARNKPDGRKIDWATFFPRADKCEQGAVPFWCKDLSLRELRVPSLPPPTATPPADQRTTVAVAVETIDIAVTSGTQQEWATNIATILGKGDASKVVTRTDADSDIIVLLMDRLVVPPCLVRNVHDKSPERDREEAEQNSMLKVCIRPVREAWEEKIVEINRGAGVVRLTVWIDGEDKVKDIDEGDGDVRLKINFKNVH